MYYIITLQIEVIVYDVDLFLFIPLFFSDVGVKYGRGM